MKKDLSEEIVVDFSKFLKKIHEVEAQKPKLVFAKPGEATETPQKAFVRKYDEHWVNCIYIGGKK